MHRELTDLQVRSMLGALLFTGEHSPNKVVAPA